MLKQPWYHGNITREKAECLVVKNSDFLVRDSSKQPGSYILTVFWGNRPMHFVINQTSSNPLLIRYCFEDEWYNSVPSLIEAYRSARRSLSSASGALLGNPVKRNVLTEYYDSRLRQMRSSPSASPHSSPLLARRRAAGRAGSFDLLLDDEQPPELDERVTPDRNVAELNAKTRCKRTGSEPLLSPAPTDPPVGFFGASPAAQTLGPPKPSRIPTVRTAGRPHVAIRNPELYEDDGRDYSDYDQVKSWPSHLAPSENVKRQHSIVKEPTENARKAVLMSPKTSTLIASRFPSFQCDADLATSTCDDYDVPRSHDSKLDLVPTKLTKQSKPVMCLPVATGSAFDLDLHQSEYLMPMNKPLEASAIATMKMILMETDPRVLAQHIVHLDLNLLKILGHEENLGLNVHCGLELITLPQGQQLRQDALERYSKHIL
jgi:hypothetical protein